MKKLLILLVLPMILAGLYRSAPADVNIGLSADEDGIREFHFSAGTHYNVRDDDIEMVRASKLKDDEMTVVFFLSNRMEVSPVTILELRLGGMPWIDITFRYGLSSEIYYVDFGSDPGPPYGKAWGHFKKTPRKEWHQLKLVDADIVNLVNLKFLAEKHQCSPQKIVQMKKQGKSFSNMHGEFKRTKAEKQKKKAAAKKSSAQGKGKKGKD